ncbi:caveolin-2-like [Scleropages formosus]|uniref:caveolin-2-like n=1 Tax=Scleropages formosus TaxID=113540 RepID=UPI000878D0E8|nr:caveolin-2-like [Scleropages formosus]
MGLHKRKKEMCVVLGEDGDEDVDELESRREDLRTRRDDRDLQHMNTRLRIGFEDVIGEPGSAHSFDGIWVGTHATFELTKYVFYKLHTILLALPVSIAGALLFALLSCMAALQWSDILSGVYWVQHPVLLGYTLDPCDSLLDKWAVAPAIQGFSVVLPSIQTTWTSCMDVLLMPLSCCLSRCVSAVAGKLGQDENPEHSPQSGFRS